MPSLLSAPFLTQQCQHVPSCLSMSQPVGLPTPAYTCLHQPACLPAGLLQNLTPSCLQRWRPGIIKYCLPTSSPNPFSNHPISSLIFLLRYDRLYKASYKAPYSRLLTQESHFKPGPPSCHAPPAIPVPPPCQHSTQFRPASRPGPPPPFIQS